MILVEPHGEVIKLKLGVVESFHFLCSNEKKCSFIELFKLGKLKNPSWIVFTCFVEVGSLDIDLKFPLFHKISILLILNY